MSDERLLFYATRYLAGSVAGLAAYILRGAIREALRAASRWWRAREPRTRKS